MKIFFLRLVGIIAVCAAFLTAPVWASIGLGFFLSTIFSWYFELIIFVILLGSIYGLEIFLLSLIVTAGIAVQTLLKNQTDQHNLLSALIVLVAGVLFFYIGIALFLLIKAPEAFDLSLLRGIMPALALGFAGIMLYYKLLRIKIL